MVNNLKPVREETRYLYNISYFVPVNSIFLYAPSHRQDSTYHSILLYQSWNTGWNENS